MTVRTRFAPSPTGFLHIGGARTALYCWLEARRRGGQFVLRIEDTDRERSTEEAVQAILDGMNWLGLTHDEGPVYQTARLERYKQVADELLKAGLAYYAYESKDEIEAMREAAYAKGEKPRYNGYYRDRNEPYRDDPNRVMRFKNPLEGTVVFEDKVKGRIEWANAELDDLVIFRSDGWPTYNFAVVVDDIDMGITEVIRGDDHVNNTPRQINIYKALGKPVPEFAHLPMILGPDGQKLSKRHGAVSVMQYRDDGFLPHALLNYLVRLGWSHGDQEIFSIEEMTQFFDIVDVNKSASAFNPDKLLWLNQQHIMRASPQRLAQFLKPQLAMMGIHTEDEAKLIAVARAQQERAKTLKEMAQNSGFFFRDVDAYDAKAAQKNLTADARNTLQALHGNLQAVAVWDKESIHGALQAQSTESGLALGKIAQPLRVAVSGTGVSPPIDITLEVLGRGETLKRLMRAIEWIDAANSAKAG